MVVVILEVVILIFQHIRFFLIDLTIQLLLHVVRITNFALLVHRQCVVRLEPF